MKKNILFLLSMAFTVLFFGSCTKSYGVVEDAMYVAEAATSSAKKMVIDNSTQTVVSLTPRMVQKASHDASVKVVVSQAALDAYNKINGTNYKMVPVELITLPSTPITIKAGQVSADPVQISVAAYTQEMKASGDKYALPLALGDASGSVLVNSQSNFVYAFEPVIITAVPKLNAAMKPVMALRQDYVLQQWSLEMRVNMDRLGTAVGQDNNQAIVSASGTPGGQIYIRFGDAPIPGNILQIKTDGTQINCNTVFQKNKWYHLAFVSDGTMLKIYVNGQVDATLALSGNPMRIDHDKFSMIASGTYFKANCMLSEVRFWTTAISQSQIQNNMFAINPNTPGLEAYWKMNEGSGSIFNDATGHGNTGTASAPPVWIQGVRSDGI